MRFSIFRFFKWLYPGMKVKRWIFLCALGLLMVGIGAVEFLSVDILINRIVGAAILLIGIILVLEGMRQMVKSLVTPLLPQGKQGLVDIVYQKRHLERGPRIVVVGGGTGLSVLLHGLKAYTSNITAIVTVTDDGGSSGRLRKELDVLPPGDIRSCLVALADTEPLMRELFQFRFEEGTELKGHNFGNLFITALSKVTGDFEKAIKESSKVLAIRGQVVPSTLKKVTLVAEHKDGAVTRGETKISESKAPVKKIMLAPSDCKPTEEALEAISSADAIVLGPGSLYTSVIPNLLVQGMAKAIAESKALIIYVTNVMTQSGETDGYTAFDHLQGVLQHTDPSFVDVCIVNTAKVSDEMLQKYKEENKYPVFDDANRIKSAGHEVVEGNVISTKDYVRHNPENLAKIIIELIEKAKAEGS